MKVIIKKHQKIQDWQKEQKEKAAGGNRSGEHRRIEQDIGVVHPDDLAQVKIIICESGKYQPVRDRVHSLRAPSERIGQRLKFRRDQHIDLPHLILHLIIFVPQISPFPFCGELPTQILQTVFLHNFTSFHPPATSERENEQ